MIDNPNHEAAVTAIRTGDLSALQQLLTDHPDLGAARLPRHGDRTLLHIATDWPGHYLNVAATIAALVAAGADPDAGCLGEHAETPLHWAASSDDIAAIDALLDNGADINAPGAVIAGGTPMADATAFGQWNAARRLLERGADTTLFEAATLGLVAEVQRHLDVNHPTLEIITSSFWGACHGGRATSPPPQSCSTTAPRSTGSATTNLPRSTPPAAQKQPPSSRGSRSKARPQPNTPPDPHPAPGRDRQWPQRSQGASRAAMSPSSGRSRASWAQRANSHSRTRSGGRSRRSARWRARPAASAASRRSQLSRCWTGS